VAAVPPITKRPIAVRRLTLGVSVRFTLLIWTGSMGVPPIVFGDSPRMTDGRPESSTADPDQEGYPEDSGFWESLSEMLTKT
jgi:hypothetical protein